MPCGRGRRSVLVLDVEGQSSDDVIDPTELTAVFDSCLQPNDLSRPRMRKRALSGDRSVTRDR
jgi:hypothetical protein